MTVIAASPDEDDDMLVPPQDFNEGVEPMEGGSLPCLPYYMNLLIHLFGVFFLGAFLCKS
jgi:hypothetical protein